MSDKFEFEGIAEEVLEEFNQDEAYKSRFIGFCQHAMKGTAEDSDLKRLIENVHLTEEERADES
jgi:hypothetical protein